MVRTRIQLARRRYARAYAPVLLLALAQFFVAAPAAAQQTYILAASGATGWSDSSNAADGDDSTYAFTAGDQDIIEFEFEDLSDSGLSIQSVTFFVVLSQDGHVDDRLRASTCGHPTGSQPEFPQEPTILSFSQACGSGWTVDSVNGHTALVEIKVKKDVDGDMRAHRAWLEVIADQETPGPSNSAPEFDPLDDPSIVETETVAFTVRATDPDGDPVTLSQAGKPAGATFVASTGEFSWTTGYDDAGSYSVVFSASDGTDTTSMTVSISVANTNRAPVVADVDDVSVSESESVVFSVSATDPDEDSLAWSVSGLPSGASFDVDSLVFSWSTTHEDAGVYVVEFTASDGDLSDSVSVSISVANTNRAPVVDNIRNQQVSETQSLSFLASASDDDGDTLVLSITGMPPAATFDPASGRFEWTPGYDDAGSHRVSFTASDGVDSDTADATIVVTNLNRPPTLAGPASVSAIEDEPISLPLEAFDPDAEVLTFSATQLPAGAALDENSGVFSWRPSYDQAGTYSVTFTGDDGIDSASHSVDFVIINRNRAPTIAPMADRQVFEGEHLSFTVVAVDADEDSLFFSSPSLPNGAQLDSSTGMFAWTPDYGQAGAFPVSMRVSDGQAAATSAMTITVNVADRVEETGDGGAAASNEQVRFEVELQALDPDQPSVVTFPEESALQTLSIKVGRTASTAHVAARILHDPPVVAQANPWTVVPGLVLDVEVDDTLLIDYADLRFHVSQAWLQSNCPPSSCTVTLWHYRGESWDPLVTRPVTRLTTDPVVFEARTTSFSPFVVGDGPAADSGTGGPEASDVIFRGPVPEVMSGEPFEIVVEIVDSSGNVVTGFDREVTVGKGAGPFGSLVGGPRVVTSVDGVARFSGLTLDRAGEYQLDASAEGLRTDRSPTILVAPGAPTRLVFGEMPPDIVQGAPFSFALEVHDASGNLADFDGPVNVGLVEAPTGSAFTGTLARSAVDGRVAFDGLRISAKGTHVVEATASGLASDATPPLNVQPVASGLSFVAVPDSTVSGQAFSIRVDVVDNQGDRVSGATHQVSILQASPATSGNLRGVLMVAAVDGSALFSDLRLDRAASYTLRAETSALPASSSPAIVVVPGAPARLAFSAFPETGRSGAAVFATVRVLDAAGNLVPDAQNTISLETAKAPDGVSLGRIAQARADDGAATFSSLIFNQPGTYRFAARTAGLYPATSGFLTINEATADDVVTMNLTLSAATVRAGSTAAAAAQAFDAQGLRVPGLTFQYRLLDDPEVGVIDSDGVFRAFRVGSARIEASLGNAVAHVPVDVIGGPLVRLDIRPSAATVAEGVWVDLRAVGRDAYGNSAPIVGDATWLNEDGTSFVLDANVPFVFRDTGTPGVKKIVASADGVSAEASVHVTAAQLPAGPPVVVVPAVTTKTVLGTASSAYSVGFTAAEAGGNVRIEPEGDQDVLTAVDVAIKSPARNLAVTIEAQIGGSDAPPGEVNTASLNRVLSTLSPDAEVGVFIRVLATEGDQALGSERMNEVLGTVNLTFKVPASYFVTSGLDPTAVRLVEYSDGRLISTEIFPTLVSPVPNAAGFYSYSARIDQFSTFAMIGLALSTPADAGSSSAKASSGFRAYDAPGPDTPAETNRGETQDVPIVSLQMDEPSKSFPAAPEGVQVIQYFELDEASGLVPGAQALVRVLVPTSSVPDARQGVLLRYIGSSWVPQERLPLRPLDDALAAEGPAPCCGISLVGLDVMPPTLDATTIPSVLSGTVLLQPDPQDNIRVVRADLYVDGQLLATSIQAPFDFQLPTGTMNDGVTSVQIIVYDYVGNQAVLEAAPTVDNGASSLGAPYVGTPSILDFAPLLIDIMLGLVGAWSLMRTMRRTRAERITRPNAETNLAEGFAFLEKGEA